MDKELAHKLARELARNTEVAILLRLVNQEPFGRPRRRITCERGGCRSFVTHYVQCGEIAICDRHAVLARAAWDEIIAGMPGSLEENTAKMRGGTGDPQEFEDGWVLRRLEALLKGEQ